MTVVVALVAAVAGAVVAVVATMAVVARQRAAIDTDVAAVAARRGVDTDSVSGSPGDRSRLVGMFESSLGAADDRQRDTDAVCRRLAEALDAVPGGVLVADEAGEVVFRNGPAGQYHGARHGDALVEAALDDLLADAVTGRGGSQTLELFGPPRRTLVVTATPLSDGNRLLGAMALVEDVTERRRLEEVRRDFVANISHELKTPVGALSLLAETLLDESDAEVSRRMAVRMVAEASRVADTIDDLLVLSQIESDEGLRHAPVPVVQVVDEALERLGTAAEVRSIEVMVEPVGDTVVVADRRQLVSALYNLLDNAVKYSDEGSRVVVGVAAGNGGVDLRVADRGIGIPARDVERVFERFYRVDAARSRQTGGTGLGLAIVRHVAANHGGEVLVESRLGEGSEFTLRLPLVPPGDGGAGQPMNQPRVDDPVAPTERTAP